MYTKRMQIMVPHAELKGEDGKAIHLCTLRTVSDYMPLLPSGVSPFHWRTIEYIKQQPCLSYVLYSVNDLLVLKSTDAIIWRLSVLEHRIGVQVWIAAVVLTGVARELLWDYGSSYWSSFKHFHEDLCMKCLLFSLTSGQLINILKYTITITLMYLDAHTSLLA